MAEHLVFYDGRCGLCDHAVQFIIGRDKYEIFAFAPLQGKTAELLLKHLPNRMKAEDSLILIENYQHVLPRTFILAKGALRICWLLGGFWKIPGAFFWLPAWSIDWAYRLVAQNRHRFFANDRCVLPTAATQHRFLP